jgi:hypothetical protein
LHHTNIVSVFGVGEQQGLHYYVMDFVDGRSLDHAICGPPQMGQNGFHSRHGVNSREMPGTASYQDTNASEDSPRRDDSPPIISEHEDFRATNHPLRFAS